MSETTSYETVSYERVDDAYEQQAYQHYSYHSDTTTATDITSSEYFETNSSVSDMTPEQDDISHRSKVVREIYTTEKSFNQHLTNAIQFFLEPMRVQLVVDGQSLEAIFANIEEIRDISNSMIMDLERILFAEQSENVASAFLSRSKDFQSFIAYGKNQSNSIETISRLQEKKPSFQAFLQSVRESQSTKLDLNSYLITPVQRLPRYKLLFNELLKQTEESHVDYKEIVDALELVSKTTKCVNEEIRKQENKAKVELIQNSLVGGPKLITETRLFVREGALMKVCRKAPKPRWFFLFSDALMYTSFSRDSVNEGAIIPANAPVHTTYTFHRLMMLSDINKIKDVKDRDNQKNAFQIVSSSQKSFTVYAETVKEKTNWLNDFAELLENKKIESNASATYEHTLGSEEVPVWVPDREASKCMFCNDSFTIINRRHHCRNCGKVVCGSCSSGKKMIPHVKKNKPVRVCLFCFDYITINENEKKEGEVKEREKENELISEHNIKFNTISRLNSILEAQNRGRSGSFTPSSPELSGSATVKERSKESHGTLKRFFGKKDSSSSLVPPPQSSNAVSDYHYNRTQSEPFLVSKTLNKGIPLPTTAPPSNGGTLLFRSPEFKPKLVSQGSQSSLSKPPLIIPTSRDTTSTPDLTTNGQVHHTPPQKPLPVSPGQSQISNSGGIAKNDDIQRRVLRSNSQPHAPPPIPSKPPISKSSSAFSKPPLPIPSSSSSSHLSNSSNVISPPISHSPSTDNIVLPKLPPKPPQRSPSSASLHSEISTINQNLTPQPPTPQPPPTQTPPTQVQNHLFNVLTQPVTKVNRPLPLPITNQNSPPQSPHSLPPLPSTPPPPVRETNLPVQNNNNIIETTTNTTTSDSDIPPPVPVRPRSNSNVNSTIVPTNPATSQPNLIQKGTMKRPLPTPPQPN